MSNPRLSHGSGLDSSNNSLFADCGLSGTSITLSIDVENASPCLDPAHLFDLAKRDPLKATLECQHSLSMLERGYQKQRRRYIAIAYFIAFHIYRDEVALIGFDEYLVAQRVIAKTDIEGTRKRLIYRVFEIIFAKTGNASSNTAYRYAHGLSHQFDCAVNPESATKLILEDGPEKLYKEAVKRNKVDEGFAEMLHQRHINRAKTDGAYAAKLLALDPAQAVRATAEDGSASDGDGRSPDRDEDRDEMLSDEDDGEEAPPSWRHQEIAQRFEKMVALAVRLSSEITESRTMLKRDPGEDDSDEDGSYLLCDSDEAEQDVHETEEVQSLYDQLLRRAVRISEGLVLLKSALDKIVK